MTEGLIHHFGAIRFRVKGSGNLKLRLLSLDEVYQNILVPLVITSLTNKELNRLSNFTQQRAKLEIKTEEINEYFEISKIVIYVTPVATNYPE